MLGTHLHTRSAARGAGASPLPPAVVGVVGLRIASHLRAVPSECFARMQVWYTCSLNAPSMVSQLREGGAHPTRRGGEGGAGRLRAGTYI